MPDPPPPVRETTILNFLKDRTEMRVADDAVDLMVSLFTTTAEAMALRAAETATEEQRTTIMDRDIQNAFEEFLGASGLTLLSPDTIHTAINGISNENLSQLIQTLRTDLTTPP